MRIKIKGFKIDQKEINKQVVDSKQYRQEARKAAEKRLQQEKLQMIEEFKNHPVTMELKGGEDGQNLSGTLGGYGNLFSFLGFSKGSNPTSEVLEFLRASIKIKKQGRTSGLKTEFIATAPTVDDFSFASMPWEGGNSWVKSIEKGISNFSYYMHKAHQASRAGVGIQIKNKIHTSSSKPTQYMTAILNNFRKRLSK